MNDKELVKYMNQMPADMIAESSAFAADNAGAPAADNVSVPVAGSPSGAGTNGRTHAGGQPPFRFGRVFGIAAGVLLFAAGVGAALLISARLRQHKLPPNEEQGSGTLTGETLAPAPTGTAADAFTPTPSPEIETSAPGDNAAPTEAPLTPTAAPTEVPLTPTAAPTEVPLTPTAAPTEVSLTPTAAPTALPATSTATAAPASTPAATPVPTPTSTVTAAPTRTPTATPTPTAAYPSPSPARTPDVGDGEEVFNPPVYSENSDQLIVRRITSEFPEYVGVMEYALDSTGSERTTFSGRYFYTGRWTKRVYKYDQADRRVYEEYSDSDGIVELSQQRYDEDGNTCWTYFKNVYADGSWTTSEREKECFIESKSSNGAMSYYETYKATGTVKAEKKYTPGSAGDIGECFAKYYSESGELTRVMLMNFENGEWYETEHAAPPATPTEAPSTPEPTPVLTFDIPEGTTEYQIEIDTGLASEYPEKRPEKVSYGQNGFYFETVNVVQSGTYYAQALEGGDIMSYSISGSIYVHFEYIGSVTYSEGETSMNIDRTRVRLDFTSESDRRAMQRVAQAMSEKSWSDYQREANYGNITRLLNGEKLVYASGETGGVLGVLLCLDTTNIRLLKVTNSASKTLLSGIRVASRANNADSGEMYSYVYDGGRLVKVSHNSSEREYRSGVLVRSYEKYSDSHSVEIIYDTENSRTVTRTVKGKTDTTVEEYHGRADLLASVTKEKVSESATQYTYTETVRYYKSADEQSVRVGSETKRYVSGSGWSETVKKYDVNENLISRVDDNSSNTHSERTVTWYSNGKMKEDTDVMLQDGVKINESISRYSESGQELYSYYAWYDSGELREMRYSESGVLLLERVYTDELNASGEWIWSGYARYYNKDGVLVEEKTIIFVDGIWKEI